MNKSKIESFKEWLFERTKRKEVKPENYLNYYKRKQLKKQLENERKN